MKSEHLGRWKELAQPSGGQTDVGRIVVFPDVVYELERVSKERDALLAVAKEADIHLHGKPGPRNPGTCCSKVCVLIDELDRVFPDWRTWA